MYCKKCGQKNADEAKFCRRCGAELKAVGLNDETSDETVNCGDKEKKAGERQSDPVRPPQDPYSFEQDSRERNQTYEQPPYNNRVNDSVSPEMIPEEYKPISMWGYLGYELLFSLPIVGFVLLIVFSVGGTKNRNLKNFARSYFCFLLILIVIIILIIVLYSALVGSVGSAAYFEGLI